MSYPTFPKLPSLSAESLKRIPTPSFLIDLPLLEENLKFLQEVSQKSGAKILLAQKAFSSYATYPLVANYLSGTTASGLYEAKLAQRKYPEGEIHVFSPSYKEADLKELLSFADDIIFNSISQWKKHRALVLQTQKEAREQGGHCASIGLRVNPAVSTGDHELYDPCAAGSRLGILVEDVRQAFEQGDLEGIDGLHFHTLCEQNSEPLLETWTKVKEDFAFIFPHLKWLNMGGGHHITRADYNVNLLYEIIEDAKTYVKGDIYLEPGEAIALNAGFLLSSVEDLVKNQDFAAILDMSPTCHTPDVIEMPYRPRISALYQQLSLEVLQEKCKLFPYDVLKGKGLEETLALREKVETFKLAEEEKAPQTYDYLLGGPSCLAGDVMGAYVFDAPLLPDDVLLMGDMAIYSMVKTNTFNGIPLPSIYLCGTEEQLKHCELTAVQGLGTEEIKVALWKAFEYDEFERRL